MRKTFIPLLIAVLLLTVVPAAMASHCDRCKIRTHPYFDEVCVASTTLPGYTSCEDWMGYCQTSGVQCTPHEGFTFELASEYVIVSVERLDETPQPAASQLAELTPATR